MAVSGPLKFPLRENIRFSIINTIENVQDNQHKRQCYYLQSLKHLKNKYMANIHKASYHYNWCMADRISHNSSQIFPNIPKNLLHNLVSHMHFTLK